jgi:hypothetical protein
MRIHAQGESVSSASDDLSFNTYQEGSCFNAVSTLTRNIFSVDLEGDTLRNLSSQEEPCASSLSESG